MVRDAFLRSINVQLDIEHPERFRHFRPTSKSVELVRSVLDPDGDRALLVVAPYGSGKSLTAGYLLQAVQNEPDRFPGGDVLLGEVAERIGELDPDLGRRLASRSGNPDSQGVGVSLYGQAGNTAEALAGAFGAGFRRAGLGREARPFRSVEPGDSEAVEGLVETAVDKLSTKGRDHLLIVWDEFGRHLEALVSEGRPGELLDLQVLAEAAARSEDVQITLLLLLHRSFMGYASALPTEVRREWNKVGGRFRVVQYVDDSFEMHRLLASLVEESRTGTPPASEELSEGSARLQGVGLFDEIEEEDLVDLLRRTWPLDPAALWLLPRVAARVAQHERTAFSFLHDAGLSSPVTAADLYEYFRGEFRSDSGPGGTHKPWLETESALAKVAPDSLEAKVLKTAFLLNLGLGGERGSTTRRRLELAVSGWSEAADAVAKAVQSLLDRKLLIHREHSDQVVVWHGTDVDLRGRLDDERTRIDSDFELVPFLEREMPPPVWRPTRHNAERGVPRYLQSRFICGGEMVAYEQKLELGLREPGTDGDLLYVIPRSEEELEDVRSRVEGISDPRTVVAVAQAPERLKQAALELAALLRMHQDSELLAQDPLVREELDHLTDDARQALSPLLDRIVIPGGGGAEWYYQGERLDLRDAVHFRRFLSAVMDRVFTHTPEILSEMVVRRRPTPVVINARKKVELGLLERYGQEAIGIEGNFADKAIFRSVFLNTGWYREKDERWRLAHPEELDAPGLKATWSEVRSFLTSPGRKSLNWRAVSWSRRTG